MDYSLIVAFRYVGIIVAAVVMALMIYRIYTYRSNFNFWRGLECGVLVGSFFALILFLNSGVGTTKNELKVRPLPEREAVEVEIVTPEPRTETLNGFEPLKQD